MSWKMAREHGHPTSHERTGHAPVRACNQNIIKTLKLVEDMIELASQGDAERDDTGCGVLYGILLDSAYKIRKIAEKEKRAHMKKGLWETEGQAPMNEKSEHATI